MSANAAEVSISPAVADSSEASTSNMPSLCDRTYCDRSPTRPCAPWKWSRSRSRSRTVREWKSCCARIPRVPCVSLLSQARMYPPRFCPKVIASSSTATVLPAPPFGLTTVTCRSPPKLRRTISTSWVISRSCWPGASLTSPNVALRMAPRTPVTATGSGGRTARRRANSSAVGISGSWCQDSPGVGEGGGTRRSPGRVAGPAPLAGACAAGGCGCGGGTGGATDGCRGGNGATAGEIAGRVPFVAASDGSGRCGGCAHGEAGVGGTCSGGVSPAGAGPNGRTVVDGGSGAGGASAGGTVGGGAVGGGGGAVEASGCHGTSRGGCAAGRPGHPFPPHSWGLASISSGGHSGSRSTCSTLHPPPHAMLRPEHGPGPALNPPAPLTGQPASHSVVKERHLACRGDGNRPATGPAYLDPDLAADPDRYGDGDVQYPVGRVRPGDQRQAADRRVPGAVADDTRGDRLVPGGGDCVADPRPRRVPGPPAHTRARQGSRGPLRSA